MKKMIFGNSLMLLGLALLLMAFFEVLPMLVFWPAVLLLFVGFVMAAVNFFV